MTLTAAAKIELIEAALAGGKYRTLQKQLRELRDAQQIILQRYLSDSYESLKEEAQRLIDELRPIAEAQDAIEIVEQKTDEVLASLPTEVIANNSGVDDHCSDTEAHRDATTKSELPEKLKSDCTELTDQQISYLNNLDPCAIYRNMTQENAVRLAPGTYDTWRDVQEILGVSTLPRHIARQKYGYSSAV